MKKINYILSLLCLLGMVEIQAADWAPISHYTCGFEADEMEAESAAFEADERNGMWMLNTPRNDRFRWVDEWYIGTATSIAGKQSMYISSDEGASTNYEHASCIMIAWHEFTLEEGDYNLALDWQCMGGGAKKTVLRLAWVPEEGWEDMVCGTSNEINGNARAWITDYELRFENGAELYEGSAATRSVAGFASDGKPHRLVVLWVNDMGADIRCPAAVVDNIEIAKAVCNIPTDMMAVTSESVVTLSWTCNAESYNLKYRMEGSAEETIVENIETSSYQTSLPYGVYQFFVQPQCDNSFGIWYPFPIALVYDSPGFNYLRLDDSNCSYNPETPGDWRDARDSLKPGKIDYGYESYKSYHTIHYRQGETDIRTYNSYDRDGNPVAPLRTIPDGDIASVRIGNWEENFGHIASVQYEWLVNAEEAKALMLKYAVVLMSSGHEREARPRFTLDIEDAETGELLSTCTSANFEPPANSSEWKSGDGWYMTNLAEEMTETTICWRDWTTVGINLQEYDGRRVRIVLISYGCTAEVHWGYAYFTLSCTSGEIEGQSCGDEPTREFIAPDGFAYRWYRADRPGNTLGTDRVFPVEPSDTNTYSVDLIYLSNESCSFTLSANAAPRFPVAETGYKVFQRDCQNYVQFTNTSYVRKKIYRRDGTYYYLDNGKRTRPELVYWENYDGESSYDWNPEFKLPNEAGTYTVSLRAKLGQCDSIIQIPIKVHDVRPDATERNIQLCEGDWYVHKGKTLTRDTTIVYEGYNRFGCDSTDVLNLRFVTRIEVDVYDTIREGESYRFAGKTYTQNTEAVEETVSHMGCDSATTLHLTVVPWLRMQLMPFVMPCQGEWNWPIQLQTIAGVPTRGKVEWSDSAKAAGWENLDFLFDEELTLDVNVPMTDAILAGWYNGQITVESSANGNDTIAVDVMVQYPDTLVRQRWNDVIGVLNAEHNGGLEFTAYQWYENGLPIEGATEPYLNMPGGLKQDAEYSVELTLNNGTRAIRTCAYKPVIWVDSEKRLAPAARIVLRGGSLIIERDGKKYSILGNCL